MKIILFIASLYCFSIVLLAMQMMYAGVPTAEIDRNVHGVLLKLWCVSPFVAMGSALVLNHRAGGKAKGLFRIVGAAFAIVITAQIVMIVTLGNWGQR